MTTPAQRAEILTNIHNFNVNPVTREIFLHGHVGDSWEDVMVDHRMANNFIKNMTLLEGEGRAPILIHQCTCGGEWPYGLAIYDRIKCSPCVVTVLAHAEARSMSSIMPLAADYRVMMPYAVYMIHHGTAGFEGEVQTVLSEARELEAETEIMLDIYIEACKGSAKFPRWSAGRIRNWLLAKLGIDSPNWYLTARESVEYGFMTAVLGDPGYETIDVLRNN